MRRRAFTLIEMTVVCAILAMVAVLVMPNLIGMKARRDRDETIDSVLRLAQRGRESAIQDGVTYSLTVNGGTTLTLQKEKAEQEGDDPRQTPAGTQATLEDVAHVDLDNGVSVGNLRLGSQDSSVSDFTMHFYPDGHSEGGGLELNYDGAQRSLLVTNRGLVSLADGALPATAETDWEAGQYVQRGSSTTP